jgi:hypothetical protein
LLFTFGLLSGCGELFGTVVDYPHDAAVSALYAMPNSANLMHLPEHFPGTAVRSELSKAGVVWTYTAYGKDECRFTAHVKRETDASSVVWTELDQLGNGDRAYLCEAVRIFGEESVAAALENRPADPIMAERQVAAAVAGNMYSVQRMIGDEMTREAKPDYNGCAELGTSADQLDCNGNSSLNIPEDKSR